MTGRKPLTFDEFRHLIATELQLDEKDVGADSSFIDDLMVDSVRMVELMLRLEEMGISIPPEAAWEIKTVADAYRCYAQWAGIAPSAAGDVAARPVGS